MTVDLNSQGDTSIGSDLVGRDKIEAKSTEVGNMNNVTGAAIGAGATSAPKTLTRSSASSSCRQKRCTPTGRWGNMLRWRGRRCRV